MVVDDEPDFRGYTVYTADGGDAIRDALGKTHIDIVVLDVPMPGEDGITLARFLREHHFDAILTDPHIPDLNGPDFFRQLKASYPHMVSRLAFITADTLGSVARRFLSESGLPYLEKPCEPQEVEALVQQLLS